MLSVGKVVFFSRFVQYLAKNMTLFVQKILNLLIFVKIRFRIFNVHHIKGGYTVGVNKSITAEQIYNESVWKLDELVQFVR